jgi:hypothetical protein
MRADVFDKRENCRKDNTFETNKEGENLKRATSESDSPESMQPEKKRTKNE